jgi:sugar phosphate permease
MSDIHISIRYLIYFLIAVGWTTLFSMSNTRGIRGYRNCGILACYILLIVMLFRVPFTSALVTWCILGVGGGLVYIAYEMLARVRASESEKKPKVSFGHVIYGNLMWPVMVPEAVEYILADIGILKAPPTPPQPVKKDETPAA